MDPRSKSLPKSTSFEDRLRYSTPSRMRERNIMVSRIIILGIVWTLSGCRGPEGPPGDSSSESLVDPLIKPKVIYTNPLANSVGPYQDFSGPITLRFNKIMDKSSLRRALSIEASAGVITIDTNNVRTVGGDVFTFTPIDSSKGGLP